MKSGGNKWTKQLEELEKAPAIKVSDQDRGSVSTAMSRALVKGNKEFVMKKSILTGENIIVRIV